MSELWCLIPIFTFIFGMLAIIGYSEDHKEGELFGDYLRRVVPPLIRDVGRQIVSLLYHSRSLVLPTPKAKRRPKNDADDSGHSGLHQDDKVKGNEVNDRQNENQANTPSMEQFVGDGEVPILCYVREHLAWFTTAPLLEQWGDDWNDIPYEDNAGDPYESKAGEYRLYRLAYTSDILLTPSERATGSSNVSVDMIHRKFTPWLTDWDGKYQVGAGATMQEFTDTVLRAGGEVFVPIRVTGHNDPNGHESKGERDDH